MNYPNLRVLPGWHPRLLSVVLGSLLLACAGATSLRAGSIYGSVANAATRANLEGAVVRLVGAAESTITNRDGTFRLDDIPPGEYLIEVSYTGLDTQSVAVTVGEGTVRVPAVQLTSEVYQMEAFNVAGEREGSAAAITAQKNASNVKSVVATDAFGHVVDANIGEMLKRVSGIATNLNEGEVDQIFVRGVGSAFNAVTLDGTRLPSPGKGKKTRSFEVDKLPADYIEAIEVIKAPTPDMDADSIGGTVKLITKSAFSNAGRRISYNFGLNHKTLRDKNSFFGGIQYSEVLGEDQKLGVYFSLGYSDNYVPQDVTQLDYQGTFDNPPFLWRFRLEDAVHLRNRTGAGLKLDYRFSERTTLHASFMFNHYDDHVDQKRLTIQSDDEDAGDYAPGYTSDRWEHLGADYTYAVSLIEPVQETYAFHTGAKHDFPGLTLDYSVSYAPGVGEEDRQNFDLRLRNQNVVLDRSRHEWYPTFDVLTPGDLGDFDRFDRPRLQSEWGKTKESVWGAEFNALKEFDVAVPASVKFGMRYRGQSTDVDEDTITSIYEGPNSLNQFRLQDYSHEPFDGRYATLPWPDIDEVYRSYREQPGEWDIDEVSTAEDNLSSDGEVREDVVAAYIMGTTDIGKLRVMGGVRMERTEVEAQGVLFEPLDTPLPDDATEAEEAARVREEYRSVTNKSSYTNYFPGVHFRYTLRPNVLIRASYSTSLGRPNFGDLMPDTSIDHEDLEISRNNTALEPQLAENYDVSLEYYYEPSGVVSIGAFYKDIENFIFEDEYIIGSGPDNGFGGEYAGYLLETKKNGGKAIVQGVELSINQQLTFLPEWARGLSAYATYTLLDAEGNYNSQGAVSDDQLVQFVPETWNVGLTYQNHGWTVRAQVNYNARFLNAYNANAAARIYDDDRLDGSLSVKYQFAKQFSVFCDWSNAFDQTVVRVQGKDLYRPQKVRYNGMRINLGISGNF